MAENQPTRKQRLERLIEVARTNASVISNILGPERRMGPMGPPNSEELLTACVDTIGLVCLMCSYLLEAEVKKEMN